MAFPLWPSAVNPNLIPAKYYTTWQAPLPTIGATVVSNVADLVTEVGNANDGDIIEIDTVGTYTLTANLVPTKTISIIATVAGVTIAGAYNIMLNTNAKTVTICVENITLTAASAGYPDGGALFSLQGTIICNRCKITNAGRRVLGGYYGDTELNGCIIHSTYLSTGLVCFYSDHSGTVTIRNSTVYLDNAGGCALGGYGISSDFVVYNTAVKAYSSVTGSSAGDYNAGTDATLPGANTHDSITWANEFNANYVPLTAMGKAGGDPANASTYDYLGNIITTVAPVGAILAV